MRADAGEGYSPRRLSTICDEPVPFGVCAMHCVHEVAERGGDPERLSRVKTAYKAAIIEAYSSDMLSERSAIALIAANDLAGA